MNNLVITFTKRGAFTLSYTYLMTKNAAILDTKMAVTFELLALEQKGKVFWMHDTFLCNLV